MNRNLIDDIIQNMWSTNEQIPIDIQNQVRRTVADRVLQTAYACMLTGRSLSRLPAGASQFNCCGLANSSDMPKDNCNVTSPELEGCQTAVEDFYERYFTAIMISAAVLAGVELFGLIFSATLASSQEAKNGDV